MNLNIDVKNIVGKQDIKINEEFLYRETPVDYDGTGTIDTIKGNTVSFNQLARELNSTYWGAEFSASLSFSDGVCTITLTQQYGRLSTRSGMFTYIANHKIYIKADIKLSNSANSNMVTVKVYGVDTIHSGTQTCEATTDWQKVSCIISSTTSSSNNRLMVTDGRTSDWGTTQVKNYVCYDLTLMGIDNLTTVAEVEEWLSFHIGNLPYYDYTQGTLISFMGTGLKTVGKNLLPLTLDYIKSINTSGIWNNNVYTIEGLTITVNDDMTIKVNGTPTNSINFVLSYINSILLKKGNYLLNGCPDGGSTAGNTYYLGFYIPGKSIYNFGGSGVAFTIDGTENNTSNLFIHIQGGYTANNLFFKPMIRLSTVSDATFEPYTSNTLSLPTLTYFPDGEMSAGTVYDELTDGNVYKRIGVVDLGNLNWEAKVSANNNYRMQSSSIANIVKKPSTAYDLANIICANYKTITGADAYNEVVGISIDADGNIRAYDTSYNTSSSASAFKTAMSGVYLYYELATPLQNYGVVDLGSLDWALIRNNAFKASLPSNATLKINQETVGLCGIYTKTSDAGASVYNGTADKIFCINGLFISNAFPFVAINDSSFSDASAFKNSLNGVLLFYELATPTETDISLDLTYPIWQNGTEQIIPVNTSVPTTAPIKANITYDAKESYVIGSGEYSSGDTATLQAYPLNGNTFVGWFDDDTFLSADNPYTYTVTQNKTLTAMFGVLNNLFVKINGVWKNGISFLKNNGSWN